MDSPNYDDVLEFGNVQSCTSTQPRQITQVRRQNIYLGLINAHTNVVDPNLEVISSNETLVGASLRVTLACTFSRSPK